MKTMTKIIFTLWILSCFITTITVAGQTNRYVTILNQIVPSMEVPEMTSNSGGWDLRMVAEDMLLRVWAVTDSRSNLTSTEKDNFKLQIETSMNYLFSRMIDDDNDGYYDSWNSVYVNDPNIDRFVLVLLLDSFYLMKQAGIFTNEIQQWLDIVEPAVEMQYNEYGQMSSHDYATNSAGNYPNMDAAYILTMGLAANLYNNSNYQSSASVFIVLLSEHMFADGAFNYYYCSNEVPVYHDVIIRFISRYLTVTSDQQAADLIAASGNYYPYSMVYPGVSETTSVPWFKQYTVFRPSSVMITIAAAVSGCGKNAWLYDYTDYAPLDSEYYYGLAYWDAFTNVTPTPCNDNIIYFDNNIGGIRGRFGNFSWVGNSGAAQSSFAGATIVSPNYFTHSGWITQDYVNYPTFNMSDPFAKIGTTSRSITCSSQDIGMIRPFQCSIGGGKTYKFSAWYSNSVNIATDNIHFRLRVVSNGTLINWDSSWNGNTQNVDSITLSGGMVNLKAPKTAVGEWKLMSFTFSVPQEVTAICTECFNRYGDGTIWFDDVSLECTDGTAAQQDSALVMVVPEVGFDDAVLLKDRAAYISGISYPKQFMIGINDNIGASFIQYNPRKPCNPPSENTESNWTVNQHWLFLEGHMVGLLKMTSQAEHEANYVRVRIRTDHSNHLKLLEQGGNDYASDKLRISILKNTFPFKTINVAENCGWTSGTVSADTLSLSDEAVWPNSYSEGDSYTVALAAYPEDKSRIDSFEQINQNSFLGFKVAIDCKTYVSVCNTSSQTANFNYDLRRVGGSVYLSSNNCPYQSPHSGAIDTDGILTINIPAYGMVCVVFNENYIPATEAAISGPFESVEDSDPGYIYVSEGNIATDAYATFSFNVQTAGFYKLKGSVWGVYPEDDSFFWRVDGGTWYTWDLPSSTGFVPSYGADRDAGVIKFWLNAGSHAVTIRGRETGAKLSKLGLELVESAICTAEADINGPFEVVTDPEPGYIYVPDGNTATDAYATFSFNVQTAGFYKLKGSVWGVYPEDDSFFWRVDGSTWYTWDLPNSTGFVPSYGADRDTGVIKFWLDAGSHTITIRGRETRAKLSKLGLELVESAICATEADIIGPFEKVNGFDPSYIYVPDGNNATDAYAYFTFNVSTAGYYRLKGWVWGVYPEDDSFFWRVDGSPWYTWDLPGSTEFVQSYGSDRDSNNNPEHIEFWLSEGQHEITIRGRETGAKLNKLILEPAPIKP